MEFKEGIKVLKYVNIPFIFALIGLEGISTEAKTALVFIRDLSDSLIYFISDIHFGW